MSELETRLKQQARALGFELVGIAPATPADGFDRLRDWLERGFAGSMDYMHRHAAARRHPSSVLPEVRSVIMVGMSYKPAQDTPEADPSPLSPAGRGALVLPSPPKRGRGVRGEGASLPEQNPSPPTPLPSGERGERQALSPKGRGACGAGSGKVARYARGTDYHDVLRGRLNRLLAWLQEERPGCRGRGVVDTAPLLERDYARRAGLGWFGKNTMLLNRRQGSYFFLGALLVDLDLQADTPHQTNHCGTCTACLDSCPTEAFAGPGLLDARRCISYLTIELKGSVPVELRPALGDWVFGCDVCQEVCPWNRKALPGSEPALQDRPDLERLDLVELLGLSPEEFRHRFRGTALMRARRRGLLRNAALALGNQARAPGTGSRRVAAALPALRRALEDGEPLVREAAAWAIAEIERQEAMLQEGAVRPGKREEPAGPATELPGHP